MLLLGVVEAAAGLFAFQTTMTYFGFNFLSIVFTQYNDIFQTNGTFDPSSPFLGNTVLLQISTQVTGPISQSIC
jgi:hypothetical protein